jgi:hypothetical protein
MDVVLKGIEGVEGDKVEGWAPRQQQRRKKRKGLKICCSP